MFSEKDISNATKTHIVNLISRMNDLEEEVNWLDEQLKLDERPEEAKHARDDWEQTNKEELSAIRCVFSALENKGTTNRYKESYYPDFIVSDSSFKKYAESLLYSDGLLQSVPHWVKFIFDIEATANALKKLHYSTTIFGEKFWYK